MATELADWLTLAAKGLIIGIAVSAPVGAVGVLVIRRALAYHPWNGFFAGLGGAVGDAIFAAMAGFGLTAVTDTLRAWQWPLRAAGGIILLIIGVALIVHIKKTYGSPREVDRKPMRRRKAFLAGLALTLGNPVVALTFVAVFAAAGLTSNPVNYVHTGILVAAIFAGTALWFLALSFSAYAVIRRYGEPAARVFDMFAAGLLIVIALFALLSPV
jgi:putative LysE/RhtB family amino acid efflux pump